MDVVWQVVIISALGPIIGSVIGVLKIPSRKFMNVMLAFSAGVMLSISFLELIPESLVSTTPLFVVFGLIIGAGLMLLLDRVLPHIHPEMCQLKHGCNLHRTSLYLIIGIFIHNFPEGLAIATSSHNLIGVNWAVAVAIAIHNIPEGVCTSAPYYFSSRKRLRSFLLSASTAIPIVVGFLLAHYVLGTISPTAMGIITAATAGIMIYISGDELIPTSCNKHSQLWSQRSIIALIIGVVFVVALGALF